jgi:serine/threonine-protein kinase
MTETGSIMGTAQYLSPEQAQGTAVVPQSDLYAVGIMLYEMLTGRLPFDGDSPVTIALKQVSEEPIPPSHLSPSVSPQLEGTVLHALAKDPDRRFPDADDFIAALEGSRASAAPLPGDATTAFAAVGASEPAHPYVPLAPDDRGGPRRWWPWALLAAVLVAGAVVAALLLTRQELRSVPSVTGADVAAAARRLRNDGFKPVVERVRNAAERDKVIAQDPSPGRRLAVGQDVTLTVSDGPGTRAVTDVEGESARTARARLRRAGFRVRERRETSADVPADRVVRTMPPIGSEIEVGGTVTVVVSSGPEQVAVPDLRGSDLADARAELADAGLEADVTRQESDKDPGTVLTQSKPPGTRVDKGSTITLTVAKQPKAVPVPDVVGDEESAAVAKIQNAELGVDVRDKQVGSPSQDGKVQSQSPAGGGKLERGKTVTITVGRFNPDLNPEGGGTSTTPTGTSTTPAPAPDTGAGGATSTTPGATPGAR